MTFFSIPADFKLSTVDEIAKKNNNWDMPVHEVYGSLNPTIFGSGRKVSLLQSVDFDKLKHYVGHCRRNGLEFNYALNFNCYSNLEFTKKGRKHITRFAQKLTSIGIRRFTAVLPSVIDILDRFVPEAKVGVSVISNVDSLMRVKAFMFYKNVYRIMVPENLNRNTSALRKLASNKAKLGFELGTIVNTLCLIDCPFRDFHYCFASHGTCGREYLVNDYYGDRCQLIRSGNPVELLKAPWIRPEDIKEYERIGVDCFKILGREFGKSADFVKVVDIYNKGSFDGNLIELLTCFSDQNFSRMFVMQNKSLGEFTRRFLDHENVCTTKNCEMCNYCNTNARLVSTNNVDSWRETFIKDRYALFK